MDIVFCRTCNTDAIQTNHKNKISNNNAIMIIQANWLKVAVVSLLKEMQAFI